MISVDDLWHELCDALGWFTVEEAEQLEKSITLTHDLEIYKNYLDLK